jgi:transposase
MGRSEVLQGLRLMKFEAVLERWHKRALSQAEAAEILGMSERTFRRGRGRHEDAGLEGLYDRRIGRASAQRVAVDRVNAMLELYRTRYRGFTVKHFHEHLAERHGYRLGYTFTKLERRSKPDRSRATYGGHIVCYRQRQPFALGNAGRAF